MNKIRNMKYILSILIATLLLSSALHANMKRPNIVLIMADDLGWMDINPTAELAWSSPIWFLSKKEMQNSMTHTKARPKADIIKDRK